MILPYMSIDLFFIAAPFLCRTDQQLRIFSRRVVAAILIAGLCFLLFPLRFAFPRPHTSGWLGAIFDWFRGMDSPFNLLPSLHAALLLLLVDLYVRNLRVVLLFAAMLWFFLISLSPVLTYQHHVIDIVGGFVLSGYCFYLFRESSVALPVLVNRRIGSYYAAGAAGAQCSGHLGPCFFGRRSRSVSSRLRTSERVRSFFTRRKESCRGARDSCWGLICSVNICRCCITAADVDLGMRSRRESGSAANWDPVPQTKLWSWG